LIDGVRNETVVTSPIAAELFPAIVPRGMREAISQALSNEDRELAETRWSDARSSIGRTQPWGGRALGSRRVDSRDVVVERPPAVAFQADRADRRIDRWYYGDWLWRLRGLLDLLAGGAGMRRGRRDPESLRVGDAVDFWRVEAIEPSRLLRLRPEMKLPARLVQFEVTPAHGERDPTDRCLRAARLAGVAYWYVAVSGARLISAACCAASRGRPSGPRRRSRRRQSLWGAQWFVGLLEYHDNRKPATSKPAPANQSPANQLPPFHIAIVTPGDAHQPTCLVGDLDRPDLTRRPTWTGRPSPSRCRRAWADVVAVDLLPHRHVALASISATAAE
jgi:hypothetical protein